MSQLGIELDEQISPNDGITALRFAGDTSIFLASSWDGAIRLYDAETRELKTTLIHGTPVLDATFGDSENTVYSGGLDNVVKSFDVSTGQETVIGSHEQAVKCVEWLPKQQLLATASWDSKLNIWDPRTNNNTRPVVAQHTLPGKAYSMSTTDTRLVVATAGRRVDIHSLSTINNSQTPPEQRRESSLKFQTRTLRCFPNDEGFAIGSIEGRVAIEFFSLDEEIQAKKYAFKCHRKVEDGKDVVYPVNAIAYNQKYGTFATGGADGVVNVWDGGNKKRLQQIAGYPTSVAAMAFSADASRLVVASSYTYEQGEKESAPRDTLYVRDMTDVEVMPRQKLPAAAV